MRVAVIVVAIVVVATPSHASKSCMTMAEARQHVRAAHLYWHGSHCWDATVPPHGIVRHIRERAPQQAEQDNQETKDQVPKWRDALSEMLPDDGAATVPTLLTRHSPQESSRYNLLAMPRERSYATTKA